MSTERREGKLGAMKWGWGGVLVEWGDVVVVGLGGRDVGVAGSKVCLRCKSDEDFWKG